MTTSVALTCALIIAARITDVTLDTIRTAAIVQGRRAFAAILGFFEAVIYIAVVAKVLLNMDQPVYVVAYGAGFACGTYLGILIEQHLAFGLQVVSLFTRKGTELFEALVGLGYPVVEVQGHVPEGYLAILYAEVPRKRAHDLIREASAIDENCFCVLNDVRMASFVADATRTASRKTGKMLRSHDPLHLKR